MAGAAAAAGISARRGGPGSARNLSDLDEELAEREDALAHPSGAEKDAIAAAAKIRGFADPLGLL